MAFKKTKTIESAQKLAAQGKLNEAINEYLKLYKEDPQDQTVLNTLGDLHVRLNRTSEGLTYFTKLADLYVSGGFLVRGIAMFKKITKLDPNNTRAVERLAELYTMQGLMTAPGGIPPQEWPGLAGGGGDAEAPRPGTRQHQVAAAPG